MVSAGRKQGRKTLRPSKFSAETINGLVDDLKTGRIPLDKVIITDEETVGLKAYIRNTGNVSFHVNYTLPNSRPLFKIGEFPKMSIKTARELTHIIQGHADKGVDVQEGMHERLVKELLAKKDKWRP